jgi:glycine/D-amino acid oxidase-like deaminating enzyme
VAAAACRAAGGGAGGAGDDLAAAWRSARRGKTTTLRMAGGLEDPTSTRTPPWVPAPLRSARALSGRPDGPPMLFAHGFG